MAEMENLKDVLRELVNRTVWHEESQKLNALAVIDLEFGEDVSEDADTEDAAERARAAMDNATKDAGTASDGGVKATTTAKSAK